MKGKYQKKKENTWETQKTKKIPKKNKKNSKINLAPVLSVGGEIRSKGEGWGETTVILQESTLNFLDAPWDG